MNDIFISYANADRKKAKMIADALEHYGLSVWWDREIPAGKTFDEIIQQNLNEVKCVVVLWSVNSIKSDWVKEEASEGLARKILVPLLIDDVPIPLGFKRIQSAHLVGWEGDVTDERIRKLIADISGITNTSPEEEEKLNQKRNEEESRRSQEEELKRKQLEEEASRKQQEELKIKQDEQPRIRHDNSLRTKANAPAGKNKKFIIVSIVSICIISFVSIVIILFVIFLNKDTNKSIPITHDSTLSKEIIPNNKKIISQDPTKNSMKSPLLYFCESYGNKGEIGVSDRFTPGSLTVMVKADSPLGLKNCSILLDKYDRVNKNFNFFKKFNFSVNPDWKDMWFTKNENSDMDFSEPGIYRVYLLDENDLFVASNIVEIIP
ncbi:MAG: toll/interleukin-1 receptor domain-containing protein [bacterium]